MSGDEQLELLVQVAVHEVGVPRADPCRNGDKEKHTLALPPENPSIHPTDEMQRADAVKVSQSPTHLSCWSSAPISLENLGVDVSTLVSDLARAKKSIIGNIYSAFCV